VYASTTAAAEGETTGVLSSMETDALPAAHCARLNGFLHVGYGTHDPAPQLPGVGELPLVMQSAPSFAGTWVHSPELESQAPTLHTPSVGQVFS
jgi:hypothetical protein